MRIEGYEIGEVLGRDELTTLYRALQLSLDRPVIVEIFGADAAGQAPVRAAFASECRRLSGLLHPNLVSGLACGEVQGRPYLITEHIDCRTLETQAEADGRFGEERALRVGIQLSRALAYLEETGLLHGDLSPATVLLSPEDVVKLDRIPAVREPGWDGRNRGGRRAGTAGYLSPEAQGGGPASLDGRSEVYALGGILYFLLSGHSPSEDAIGELVGEQMIDRPVPLRSRCSTLGKPTLGLVSRFMAIDPADRVPDATAAGVRVEEALEEAEQRTRLHRGRGHVRRIRTRPRRRRRR